MRVFKRRAVIFSVLFSFVLGCTLTVNLLGADNCIEKMNFQYKRNDSLLQKSTANSKFLITLILSQPASAYKRNVIRGTWLSLYRNGSDVQYYFVIGGAGFTEEMRSFIEEEQYAHHDLIVLPNVYDEYRSLSHKVLQAFVWVDKEVKHFQYLLKCDDDSFVLVDKVVSELQTIKLTLGHSLYWGFFNGRAQVKLSGKWKESNWILCDHYLPYALGGGYVLSQKLVHFIAVNAEFLR
jgi:Galactosyltransferase.